MYVVDSKYKVTSVLMGVPQAREGEFRVPHQEQPNLDPYFSPSNDEEVRYPTIGQRKPAAHKVAAVALCIIMMMRVLANTTFKAGCQ